MLGLEHRYEVFVTKLVLWPVRLDVVLVFRRLLHVHHSWIPFAAESWDRISSPVNENPELGVAIPLGRLIFLKRLPVWPEGALTINGVDIFQQGGALCVIFAAGFLPYLIKLFGILRNCRRRSTLRI